MNEKILSTRIIHKHDLEANWNLISFIPNQGEIIVYDIDENYTYERIKIGDGVTDVKDLPFVGDDVRNTAEELYKKMSSDMTLRFYCVEDVTIVTNGVSKTYPANSNVEVKFVDTDVFEIIPTSDNSILQLNGYPGALGTYYSWLEGVKQFSNILFDMNNVDFYSKWSQGNQGMYQVQFAQYINCIFWSDNAYVSDVTKRTNYTLYYTSQLPLCYSTIPDNTFKAFFLAFGVNNDPNWGNPVYRESFAKATWATQAFSYYGARTVGIFGHDSDDFNIVLPKDCRGLMRESTAIENAGTFDAINVTNFGAKSGSWRDAFRMCSALRNLYIKNLKVSLNVSWSPINYESISYIISTAANTNAITISISPYTYYLLKDSDFELAASKNITIELLTTNYVEDRRLNTIPNNLANGSAEGSLRGINTLAEDDSYTMGVNAFAIGDGTKASGKNSFASGQGVEATGSYAHAEGYGTYATAAAAHAEGYDTHATARYAHAEGASTTASGNNSHAEGNNTTASGHYSHAEGNFTTSAGGYSHAEGNYAQTGEDGTYAHAEGSNTKALKTGAHAEGNYTEANAVFAHTEGYYTKAGSPYQHVRGKYNIVDENNTYSTIIGNGDADTNRRNIYTMDWEGNGWYAGNITVGPTQAAVLTEIDTFIFDCGTAADFIEE